MSSSASALRANLDAEVENTLEPLRQAVILTITRHSNRLQNYLRCHGSNRAS